MCEIANKIKSRRLELGLTLEDVAMAIALITQSPVSFPTGFGLHLTHIRLFPPRFYA